MLKIHSPEMYRILLEDDHSLVRRGLRLRRDLGLSRTERERMLHSDRKLSPTPIFLSQYDATLEIDRNLLDKNIYKRVNSRSSEPESWASNSTEQLHLTNLTRARAFVFRNVFSVFINQ